MATLFVFNTNKPNNPNKKSTRDFDYLYDGGCLDNVWNPSNAMMNLISKLKPKRLKKNDNKTKNYSNNYFYHQRK